MAESGGPFRLMKPTPGFAGAGAVVLSSSRANGAGHHRLAIERRRDIADRRRHRGYPWSRALRGTGRAAVSPLTHAFRNRTSWALAITASRMGTGLSFDAAGFGHGKPIAREASPALIKKLENANGRSYAYPSDPASHQRSPSLTPAGVVGDGKCRHGRLISWRSNMK